VSYQQAFYTSCSVGLRGSKGFQINAATPTMDPSTLELIERVGVYVPPVSAPTRPTSEEIEQFPLSLVFYRIQDGRTVLGQSKYVGLDYSGRYGNYFSHCLVAQAAERSDRDFLPIELWRSQMWTARESSSTALPSIDHPEAGGVIDPQRVNEFLNQVNRGKHVPAFLTAVEAALITGRRIVIIDDNDSMALWIAAGSYALPHHLAWLLTFTTYVKNPYQTDALITGTTSDSDFAFSPYEIEHQYSVFDFVGNRFSPIVPSAFAKSAAAAYRSGRSEELANFSRFVEGVAPDLPGADLTIAFGCYALANGMPVEGVDNAALLKWCAPRVAHLKPEFIRSLAEAVGQSAGVPSEVIGAFTELYRAVLSAAVNPSIRDAVERAYVALIIQNCDTLSGDALTRLVEGLQLSAAAKGTGQDFRSAWFEKARGTRDPSRLCALLVLGERLGLLSDNSEIVRRLVETLIAPALGEQILQQTVLRLILTALGDDLISGIAAYLQANSSNGRVFHAIRSFLIRPEVLKGLETYATAQSAVELYYRLIGEQAADRPDQRADAFRHCLSVTQRLRAEITPSRLEAAFDAVWQGTMPKIAEAILILDTAGESNLAKTSIPSKFGDLLAQGLDLTRDDSQRDDLAQRLRGGPLLAALGETRYVVDAWNIAKRLRSPESDPGASISTAIQIAGRLQDTLRAALSELAARRLLDIQERETHRDLLLRANATLGQPFIGIYSKCARLFLSRSHSPDTMRIAALFWVWWKASSSVGDQQSRVLLNDILRPAVKHWRQSDFQKAQSNLGTDASVQSAWAQWIPRGARPRAASSGVIGRLTRWFVIFLAIIIGITAGILAARRLFRPSEDNVQVASPEDASGSEAPSPKGRSASPKDKKIFTKQAPKRRPDNDR
jgi:hypothetical protein